MARTYQTTANGVVALSVVFALAVSFTKPVNAQEGVVQAEVPAQYRYWTSHWSFEDIDVVKLLKRLKSIGIEVPVEARGDVSLEFDISIPLNGLRDGKAYRFDGTLSSKRLQLEQLMLADFSTGVQYKDGTLSLRNLITRWLDSSEGSRVAIAADGGRLSGSASVAVIPRGAITATLTAERLAIAPLFDLVVTATNRPNSALLDGTVSGTLDASVPLPTLDSPSTWTMDGDLQAMSMSLGESLPLSIDTGPISLRGGKLKAENVRFESPVNSQVKMVASVSADLKGDRPFEFDVKGNDVPLQSIAALAALGPSSTVTGSLDIDAHGSGKLSDQDLSKSRWELAGRIASPALYVLGLQIGLVQHSFEFDSSHLSFARLDESASEQILIDRLSANYVIGEDSAELNELDAAIFGGTINGSASIARNEQGTHQIKLSWDHINPQVESGAWFPQNLQVSLLSSGQIDASVPANALDQPAKYVGTAKLAIDQLMIASEKIGDGQLELRASDGQLSLQGRGELFGGTFNFDTTTSLAAASGWFDLSSNRSLGATKGELRFNQIGLRRVSRFLDSRNTRRVDGFVSGGVTLLPQEHSKLPHARASLSFDNVAIDGTLLTRRLFAELRADDQYITIDTIRGGYAGGQMEAVGRIAIEGGVKIGKGRLQVRAAAIDASAGLMPISIAASKSSSGTLSGRLVVETGPSLRVTGNIEVRDSRVFSIPAGDAHATIVASADNDLARWSLSLRSIESMVDHGRIFGDAMLRSSTIRPGAFDLTSNWKARRLDFGKILEDAGGASSYAKGNIDGMLSLNGTGVRTTADLSGRFDAKLDGTQARAIPGLASAQAYLGALSLAGTRFDEGRLRGSIGAGIMRIDDFWLIGPRLQVFADGRVQIASGRMDVSAVISTGNFDVESAAVGALTQQLAIGAAPPVALFLEVNRLLSNRTLYVDILGPITDPRLRLKPLKNLESGLARFVVREAAATVLPVVAGSGVLASSPER